MCSDKGWKSDVRYHAQHFQKSGENVWNSTESDRGKGVIEASIASHRRGHGRIKEKQT